MRILQVHKWGWHRDGASNYAWDLSTDLERAGHQVIRFAMQHPENEPSPYASFFVSNLELGDPRQVNFFEKIKVAQRFIYSSEAKKKLERLLDEFPVDIAHIHNIYHHITPSIFSVFKKRDIPVVMTLHDYNLLTPNYTFFHHGAVHEEDGRGWYWSCVKNKCVKNSRAQSLLSAAEMIWHHKIKKYYEEGVDQFIAPSEFMYNKCLEFGWNKNKFVTIPHPIDTTRWKLETEDGGYVAYAGRLSEEKGIKTLLAAAAHTPHIQYKIIGTGPDATQLQQSAQALHNVEFTGFKTGAELHRLLANARLLVLPSVWYENYPISVLEAKAMGKIILASDIGGLSELVSSEFLFPPGNVAALTQLITRWHDESLGVRRAIGLRSRQEVEFINNPHKHLGNIGQVYQRLLNT